MPWFAASHGSRFSVYAAMISAFGKQFVSAAMFKLVNDILTFVGPYLLSAVIVFLQVLYCTVHSLPCVR